MDNTDLSDLNRLLKGKTVNKVRQAKQALAYEKQRCVTIPRLITKLRGYRHVKSRMPPTK